MKIESEKSEINRPAAEIFSFLSDFNNFQKIMPPQVTNWKSTPDECSFAINGMPTIGMKIVEKNPNSKIKISSGAEVPFDFTITIYLTEINSLQTTGQIVFESDLNPMMAIMVEKPLKNFFNLLAGRLKEI